MRIHHHHCFAMESSLEKRRKILLSSRLSLFQNFILHLQIASHGQATKHVPQLFGVIFCFEARPGSNVSFF